MKEALSKLTFRDGICMLFVALLFAGSLLFSNTIESLFRGLMETELLLGIGAFVFLAALSSAFAPMTIIPLIPIAVRLWGSLPTALLSILGWSIGGVCAFLLARRYGHSFIARFIDMNKARDVVSHIVGKHSFLSVLALRTAIPNDFTSYAIGLFINISLPAYILVMLLANAPFGFAFAYTAGLPLFYQIAAVALGIIFVIFGFKRVKQKLLNST